MRDTVLVPFAWGFVPTIRRSPCAPSFSALSMPIWIDPRVSIVGAVPTSFIRPPLIIPCVFCNSASIFYDFLFVSTCGFYPLFSTFFPSVFIDGLVFVTLQDVFGVFFLFHFFLKFFVRHYVIRVILIVILN